ncbi:preprotein translocase subunit SecE [Enterococcus sp. BWB1-3]|uniref:preprotein translocase subunit SecE n=1 Tax=unclassified Enterococcus TaxID=2608891 RepID=UPI00192043B1|nr:MULTISPECIES: preprotein translocase subunit SecE [unclassified Enterococcus]MBL1228987.1 preprotein translocase subunit SecE [Enterococcus sp. BWB1-3]MCB5956484.1 preprotein translocase subunit SecE [Enterococcus sp. CWB-B31]
MKFFKGVREEMKQVTWPGKRQLRKDTLTVIETTILFGVMFFIMDTAIQTLFSLILR